MDPIRIGDWRADEDFPVFPIGSKPKRMVVCPEKPPRPELIAGHSYLFKIASGWQEQQAWSEIIAARIGALVDLDVPPCFVAIDEITGEMGALIEFFYGYPVEADSVRLIHASDVMTRVLADKKRGRPHGVRTNLMICRLFQVPDPIKWWARVLTFDALIGNTDRHPENWGVLVARRPGLPAAFSLAPAFDNGTSLGYELPERRLKALLDEMRLAAYIEKGTHHCGWDRAEDGPMSHFELCARYAEAFPEELESMRQILRFDHGRISAILDECSQYAVKPRFSTTRAKFVMALIEARRRKLVEILDREEDGRGELD